MFRRLALLNLLLLGMAGLLAYQTHEVWNSPAPNFFALGQNPSSGGAPRGKGPAARTHNRNLNPPKDPKKPSPAATLPPMEAYQIIGQTNPFRPDRKEWVPPPPPPSPAALVPPKPALPPPGSFRLYGTLNMPDGSAVAFLEGPMGAGLQNPSASLGRRSPALPLPAPGRSEAGRARRYRINDSIGGYRIVDIQRDRVVLDGEGLRAEVLLRDPNNLKPRPAALPPQLLTPPASLQPPGSPQPGVPPPPPPRGSPALTPRPLPGQPRASAEEERAASAPPSQPAPRGRNRQVIQTPFGPKVIYR